MCEKSFAKFYLEMLQTLIKMNYFTSNAYRYIRWSNCREISLGLVKDKQC